jgi:hypothetical protein
MGYDPAFWFTIAVARVAGDLHAVLVMIGFRKYPATDRVSQAWLMMQALRDHRPSRWQRDSQCAYKAAWHSRMWAQASG